MDYEYFQLPLLERVFSEMDSKVCFEIDDGVKAPHLNNERMNNSAMRHRHSIEGQDAPWSNHKTPHQTHEIWALDGGGCFLQ